MLRPGPTRLLDDRDRDAALGLLAEQPVTNVFVASRVESSGLDPWRLGAEVWGYVDRGRLTALCYSGANLVPVGGEQAQLRTFADRARRQGRRCSSIFGDAPAVLGVWAALGRGWGRPREVREEQPLLAIDHPPEVAPDPDVRLVRPEEIDALLPACVAMYAEEVGVSPLHADGGSLYRARVAELISTGRAFARFDAEGRVVFKAEVGAATTAACQVQGVWTSPALRNRGIATAGTAAVVIAARRIAPVVSLYVNDFNSSARRVYDKVGFTRVGTFASVLF